ncbi:MAG: PstS family phosphate ABC transporter substrate-binding protein [Caldilineaceae bacterium]|nr:PstS family phosphate ABC transporter substrate-binding protein [Caldilineaceae bacterium]
MRRLLFALLALTALVLVACGAPAPAPAAPAPAATQLPAAEAPAVEMAEGELPEVNPLELSGPIIIAGSSTVYPLTEAMVERFQNEGFSGNITVDSIGSGAGFERFCVAGESDISNASRPIRESEVANCQSIGREPLEIRVGTDALAVVTHPDNDFATDVTIEELALLFSTATLWSDVRPEWPGEQIQRFSPGTDSGTFDYFVEEVFGSNQEPILSAANLQLSEDDNILVQGVEGSLYGIGYFGYAYYEENTGRLNVLNIDGVEPTAETVDSGDYPLARPLFIYSAPSILCEKPQVAGFVNFYLTYVNEEVIRVGYFPADENALAGARDNWIAAMASCGQ